MKNWLVLVSGFVLVFCAGCSKTKTAPDARLSTLQKCCDAVAKQPWGASLQQIPATVIDVGVLKSVPYTSFRVGNYEMNVYGDPENPACIEVGIYKELLASQEAKQQCFDFIESVLKNPDDQRKVRLLRFTKDLIEQDGLTFEVTPEMADDAYGGWWVSVYDEKLLDQSRASPKELEQVTERKDAVPAPEPPPETVKPIPETPKPVEPTPTPAPQPATPIAVRPTSSPVAVAQASNLSGWTANEMRYSRPSAAGTLPSSGRVYVRAYTRKDGTYVSAHTRSAPRR